MSPWPNSCQGEFGLLGKGRRNKGLQACCKVRFHSPAWNPRPFLCCWMRNAAEPGELLTNTKRGVWRQSLSASQTHRGGKVHPHVWQVTLTGTKDRAAYCTLMISPGVSWAALPNFGLLGPWRFFLAKGSSAVVGGAVPCLDCQPEEPVFILSHFQVCLSHLL